MQLAQRTGLLFLVLLLTACSGAQPYQYHANRESPTGPGLFTGADKDEIKEQSSTPQAKD